MPHLDEAVAGERGDGLRIELGERTRTGGHEPERVRAALSERAVVGRLTA